VSITDYGPFEGKVSGLAVEAKLTVVALQRTVGNSSVVSECLGHFGYFDWPQGGSHNLSIRYLLQKWNSGWRVQAEI
jgi:hypothetical protein